MPATNPLFYAEGTTEEQAGFALKCSRARLRTWRRWRATGSVGARPPERAAKTREQQPPVVKKSQTSSDITSGNSIALEPYARIQKIMAAASHLP